MQRAKVPQRHPSMAFMMAGLEEIDSKLDYHRQSIFVTTPQHLKMNSRKRVKCPAYQISNFILFFLSSLPALGVVFSTQSISVSEGFPILFWDIVI